MATPHIQAESHEVAEYVLMPGDPLRAEYIASTFLEGAKQFNAVRNMLGFTGTWKGVRVSAMGSGMGMPSIAIYAEELCRFYGAARIVRVGSCGALQEHLKLRDLVMAVTACTDSNVNAIRFRGASFAPAADFSLGLKAYRAAEKRGVPIHAGTILSTDTFYGHDGDIDWKLWASYGVLAVEMETAALYTIAAKHRVQALTLLTVSDSLCTGEAASPEERERSYGSMVEVALDAVIA